jgi:uncharacterized protein
MPHAVITGASSGFGALFARRLAARGQNLILTARRTDRLEALAAELMGAHKVDIVIVPADLGAPGGVATLMEAIAARGLAVETLINNAGFGQLGPFAAGATERQVQMIAVNIAALTELTHRLLPDMLAAGKGAILNVASTAAFQPGPNMAVYYATKAYVLSFSEALHEEVKGRGVRVTALCPGPTETEFAGEAEMNDTLLFRLLRMKPEPVVDAGLAGLAAGRAIVIPGLMNKLMQQSTRITPRFMIRKIAAMLQASRG